MKINYDKEVDALNVSIRPGTVAKTMEVAPEVLLDIDKKGAYSIWRFLAHEKKSVLGTSIPFTSEEVISDAFVRLAHERLIPPGLSRSVLTSAVAGLHGGCSHYPIIACSFLSFARCCSIYTY